MRFRMAVTLESLPKMRLRRLGEQIGVVMERHEIFTAGIDSLFSDHGGYRYRPTFGSPARTAC